MCFAVPPFLYPTPQTTPPTTPSKTTICPQSRSPWGLSVRSSNAWASYLISSTVRPANASCKASLRPRHHLVVATEGRTEPAGRPRTARQPGRGSVPSPTSRQERSIAPTTATPRSPPASHMPAPGHLKPACQSPQSYLEQRLTDAEDAKGGSPERDPHPLPPKKPQAATHGPLTTIPVVEMLQPLAPPPHHHATLEA